MNISNINTHITIKSSLPNTLNCDEISANNLKLFLNDYCTNMQAKNFSVSSSDYKDIGFTEYISVDPIQKIFEIKITGYTYSEDTRQTVYDKLHKNTLFIKRLTNEITKYIDYINDNLGTIAIPDNTFKFENGSFYIKSNPNEVTNIKYTYFNFKLDIDQDEIINNLEVY